MRNIKMEKKGTGQIVLKPDTESTHSDEDKQKIKVITLNCWGLYGVSKFRRERFHAIGEFLVDSDFDVVLLQEVWCDEDFDLLVSYTRSVLPFSHYFDQGIIGSGTCILTKHRILNANYHEFAVNGYPLKFWHGDWYAAKGLGICQIDVDGLNVTVFVSHYHAFYGHDEDIYLGHRVIHGLESAQWLNLTSAATDLTLYCGDFNTDPGSVPYRLLKAIGPLKDAWAEYTGGLWGGETCEVPENTFTAPRGSIAKRIDYIMYRAGPGFDAETENCWLPLGNTIPERNFSYSDHEAVAAIISVRKQDTRSALTPGLIRVMSGAEFRKMASLSTRDETIQVVHDAVKIIDTSLKTVDSDQFKYALYSFAILLALVLTFIPSAFVEKSYYFVSLDVGLFLPRFILTIFLVIFVLMATLFNKRERNALKSTKKELLLLLDDPDRDY